MVLGAQTDDLVDKTVREIREQSEKITPQDFMAQFRTATRAPSLTMIIDGSQSLTREGRTALLQGGAKTAILYPIDDEGNVNFDPETAVYGLDPDSLY